VYILGPRTNPITEFLSWQRKKAKKKVAKKKAAKKK